MAKDESLQAYLLRIEAINLGNFIYDTDDLSTVRGAGLLLLNSSKFLCGEPDYGGTCDSADRYAPGQCSLFSREENGSYGKDGITLDLVSSGASITVFRFQAEPEQAERLRCDVDGWLRHHDWLRHATFAVSVAELGHEAGAFSQALEQSSMQTRLLQMRAPNISIGQIQTSNDHYDPLGFCDVDHKRARSVNLKTQRTDISGSSYARAADKNHVSDATHWRRAYGRNMNVALYQMLGDSAPELEGFWPSWEFEEIGRRDSWCVQEDPSADSPFNAARNKIAVIYIDGNKFGDTIRQHTQKEDWSVYRDVDSEMQSRRRLLMCSLIRTIKDQPRWQVAPPDLPRYESRIKTRIETLLWGGDELIWVVPAWCGLEAVRFFFQATSTSEWQLGKCPLTHAMGVVFCSHKSPIRSVVCLAKELAESVKMQLDNLGAPGSGVPIQHQSTSNAMAYEVLESFDHLGRDFAAARTERRMPQMRDCDAILTAAGVEQICHHLRELKDTPLPRRRVHQIVQVLRRCPYDVRGAADDSAMKEVLNKTAYGKLIRRAAQTAEADTDQLQRRLNDPLHWGCLSKLPAKWFHLMELWDYAGYPEST